MSLTSLLRDPESPVSTYLDGISPRLKASGGRGDGSRAAAEALGLSELARSRLIVSPFPGADLPLLGTALDFRARIELGGFDPRCSEAAAGAAALPGLVPFVENGLHRARILAEAFGVAETLLRKPHSDLDLDRAAILLAHCDQVSRDGVTVLNGSVGVACDEAVDGRSFSEQLDSLALADIRSLMLSNAEQLETWQEQIAVGDRYEPNPRFISSDLVGGADADWAIGETLIDCKVYGDVTVPKLRGFLRQLLGYVMLDSDDSLNIRRVGIWLPRQGLMPSWSLTRLLGGDPEELLPLLRQGFILATGKTQLELHVPVTTKHMHQVLADNRHTPYDTLAALALSEDDGIRWRVGRNVVTPEAAVRTLARDTHWQVREGVARNEAAPDDVLEALSRDRSVVVRRAVAANPGAPRPMVKALTADINRDVQWAARTNDGVRDATVTPPIAVRSAVARQGKVQIKQNRDSSAFDSDWFSDFLQMMMWDFPRLPVPLASYRWALQSGRSLSSESLTQRELPDEVLADLLRGDRPYGVRRTAAMKRSLADPAVRESLLNDVDPDIRWHTLKRTTSHPDEALSALLTGLAASREARIRFRTGDVGAQWDRRYTAAEYDHQTLCLIASHPSTPQATLLTLMSNSSAEVLANLIENSSLGAEDRDSIVQPLLTSKSVTARELLASLASVPEAILIKLASDRDVRVRTAVAENHAAPPTALSRLATDRKRTVRLSALENPATPGDVACSIAEAMLLTDDDEELHEVLDLLGKLTDVGLPSEVIEDALDRLSKSRVRDPDMRVVAARDKRCGEKTLSRLARSAEGEVRLEVAGNPNTPAAILEQLAGDIEPSVRAMVARNMLSPTSALVALSQDAEVRVRAAALKNPAMPEEVLREAEAEMAMSAQRSRTDRAVLVEMAANKRAEVRMEVAFDPAADADVLALLGGERKSVQVRRAVAANPNASAALLRSLSDDKDAQVRQAVAFNGSTPADLLIELAGRSIDLAILVAINPDIPNTVLDALARDSDPLVRFVADSSRQALDIRGNASTQAALEGRGTV
jgi:hypothetical protein